ncbi:MAG TPA: heterodisulfide reductase-related iron-sulfur binding cluster [Bryobacteraceae bacterium]|nr:heterodisulfide reductase-related iron-sulfur binding cluster [Bryobacteraceae bacterium]
MAASETRHFHDAPRQKDLDRCVHCGLCLNACPTYRELGVEMDSPRGRIYQMVQVATGQAKINPDYILHLDLCLACRGCETACPSGVEYGRLIEAARAEIVQNTPASLRTRLIRSAVFKHLLPSRSNLKLAGAMLYLYQASGLQKLVRSSGILELLGPLGKAERLTPAVQTPSFYRFYGKVLPAEGRQKYRVAVLGGCIANICFARLNEATVRVLQKNGCEVSIPDQQTCCGALHVHAGLKHEARKLARRNIDTLLAGNYDAIITNAAGCGSTLKEYDELLEEDTEYAANAMRFKTLMKDVTEFLASIELNPELGALPYKLTYQDSCHLAHGQKIKAAPRSLLRAVPGITFREMPMADLCCGSAGIYNVVHNDMSMQILERKMQNVNSVNPDVIATANPGCMLQLEAGARMYGRGQRVAHVVEILDESYRAWSGAPPQSA